MLHGLLPDANAEPRPLRLAGGVEAVITVLASGVPVPGQYRPDACFWKKRRVVFFLRRADNFQGGVREHGLSQMAMPFPAQLDMFLFTGFSVPPSQRGRCLREHGVRLIARPAELTGQKELPIR